MRKFIVVYVGVTEVLVEGQPLTKGHQYRTQIQNTKSIDLFTIIGSLGQSAVYGWPG